MDKNLKKSLAIRGAGRLSRVRGHVNGCVLLATTVLLSCGSPARKADDPPVGKAGGAYDLACRESLSRHATDVTEKKYLPVTLSVHQWPGRKDGDGPGAVHTTLTESEFVSALAAPATAEARGVRTTLVLARGGTGKSRLAEAVAAQSCSKLAVFRVDLNTDIAAHVDAMPPGQNPIAVHIAHTLNLDAAAGAEAALNKELAGQTWLVMLDSLDEVPLQQRTMIASAIDDLIIRVAPTSRAVVMTRPPVFTSNYGLKTVDGRLEIPQLTCDQTEDAIDRLVADPAERKNFQEFVTRYGINRRVSSPERCYYPHMSTYRDLDVVQRLARNASFDQNTPDFKDFHNSRAQVYTYFLTAQLIKDLQGVAILPAEALATIDRLIAAKKPGGGQRNLAISVQDCVAVAPGEDAGAKQVICERLLQSSLFHGEGGAYHFANQSLGDLFLARWTSASLVEDGKVDCTLIAMRAELLESNEVAGFLVGQRNGQLCLAEISTELCKRGGFAEHIFEQLDQGLPAGIERTQAVENASKNVGADAPNLCVSNLLDKLNRNNPVPAAVELPPVPTPTAPPAADATKPAKGAKGKKK